MLINNSAAGARAYGRWLGLLKASIRVVHNGFDFDEELLTRCCRQRAAYRERQGIPPAAPEFVKHHFGLERMLDEILQVYTPLQNKNASKENHA
ncbi:MAG: hypothetical protein WBR29_01850 [Gammaproteobacteria bacterium]